MALASQAMGEKKAEYLGDAHEGDHRAVLEYSPDQAAQVKSCQITLVPLKFGDSFVDQLNNEVGRKLAVAQH